MTFLPSVSVVQNCLRSFVSDSVVHTTGKLSSFFCLLTVLVILSLEFLFFLKASVRNFIGDSGFSGLTL